MKRCHAQHAFWRILSVVATLTVSATWAAALPPDAKVQRVPEKSADRQYLVITAGRGGGVEEGMRFRIVHRQDPENSVLGEGKVISVSDAECTGEAVLRVSGDMVIRNGIVRFLSDETVTKPPELAPSAEKPSAVPGLNGGTPSNRLPVPGANASETSAEFWRLYHDNQIPAAEKILQAAVEKKPIPPWTERAREAVAVAARFDQELAAIGASGDVEAFRSKAGEYVKHPLVPKRGAERLAERLQKIDRELESLKVAATAADWPAVEKALKFFGGAKGGAIDAPRRRLAYHLKLRNRVRALSDPALPAVEAVAGLPPLADELIRLRQTRETYREIAAWPGRDEMDPTTSASLRRAAETGYVALMHARISAAEFADAESLLTEARASLPEQASAALFETVAKKLYFSWAEAWSGQIGQAVRAGELSQLRELLARGRALAGGGKVVIDAELLRKAETELAKLDEADQAARQDSERQSEREKNKRLCTEALAAAESEFSGMIAGAGGSLTEAQAAEWLRRAKQLSTECARQLPNEVSLRERAGNFERKVRAAPRRKAPEKPAQVRVPDPF